MSYTEDMKRLHNILDEFVCKFKAEGVEVYEITICAVNDAVWKTPVGNVLVKGTTGFYARQEPPAAIELPDDTFETLAEMAMAAGPRYASENGEGIKVGSTTFVRAKNKTNDEK